MSIKEKSMEIYQKHLHLATADGRSFRKTVMDEMMTTFGITLASAATNYNNCKKNAPVEGLGRAIMAKGVHKAGTTTPKTLDTLADNDCFTVIELVNNPSGTIVGHTESFAMQGDASECFDGKVKYWPFSDWVMIAGLGPNPKEVFRIEAGEKEIKRFMSDRSRTPIQAVTA